MSKTLCEILFPGVESRYNICEGYLLHSLETARKKACLVQPFPGGADHLRLSLLIILPGRRNHLSPALLIPRQ